MSAHVDTFTLDRLPPKEQWPKLLFDLTDLRYPEQLNCGSALLDDTIDRFGADRACLRSDEATWDYGQTRDHVDRIAHVLVADLDVVPGNRVLLRGPNNLWLAVCWLAVMKVGAVAVTTMPLLRAGELRKIIDTADVGLALCDHRFLDELAAADTGLTLVPFGGAGAEDLTQRMSRHPARFEAVATAADDPCLIAFTSGTTGVPKGCIAFHRDVLAICDTFSKHVIKPTQDDVFTGSPPFAFTFGLGQLLLFPLRVGASALLLEQGSPPLLAEAIERHGATICGTAPTAYRAMLQQDDLDLSTLRRGVSAGETLPAHTWEQFKQRTGVELIDGIGSTEMLHIFIAASDHDIRPGATGLPVPGYAATILDDDGEPVPDGTIGRLAVRGPTGCRYLDDPRQQTYVQDGWNLTGDAFLRDEDGYFWYQARADDMIVSSGYNIAGPEVEEALLTFPGVVEAGVIGVPDEDRGAIVKAFVVTSDELDHGDETRTLLQEHVKATIAPYKYPRAVDFIDELPRTQTGKLQRFRLRDRERD